MNVTFWICAVVVAVIGYLLGSINFAVIISSLYAKQDIRNFGSGNAGMTNILRTYGKIPAALTAVGDIGKGMAAVIAARIIFGLIGVTAVDGGYIAGAAAFVGHIYPAFFGLRGGKGILTGLGIIVILNPYVAVALCVILVPMVFIVKIVSLISVIGAVLFPIFTYFAAVIEGKPPLFNTIFALVLGAIVVYKHKTNIKRLLNGTEPRFGQNKDK